MFLRHTYVIQIRKHSERGRDRALSKHRNGKPGSHATELISPTCMYETKSGSGLDANFRPIARQCGRQPIATYRACQPKIWPCPGFTPSQLRTHARGAFREFRLGNWERGSSDCRKWNVSSMAIAPIAKSRLCRARADVTLVS